MNDDLITQRNEPIFKGKEEETSRVELHLLLASTTAKDVGLTEEQFIEWARTYYRVPRNSNEENPNTGEPYTLDELQTENKVLKNLIMRMGASAESEARESNDTDSLIKDNADDFNGYSRSDVAKTMFNTLFDISLILDAFGLPRDDVDQAIGKLAGEQLEQWLEQHRGGGPGILPPTFPGQPELGPDVD